MRRLPVDLFGASPAQLHQRRSCQRMSKWDTWQDNPPWQTSLILSLCTRITPNPIGPQQIWRGGASRRERSRKWGDVLIRGPWEIHTEAIIDVKFGDADVENCNPEGMYKLLNWREKSVRKSTISIANNNGYILSVCPISLWDDD